MNFRSLDDRRPRIRIAVGKAAESGVPIPDTARDLSRARIVGDGEEADFILMSAAEIEELLDRTTEEAAAQAAYHRTRDQESVPDGVVGRLLAGESPVRVWREHRGLTLTALADKARIGKGYLSQIENGERDGTVETLRKLANALGVDLDDLV